MKLAFVLHTLGITMLVAQWLCVCVCCSSKTFTWLTHISHVVAIFYAIDLVTWNSIAIFESSFSISNICLLSFRLHTCITRRNLFVWSVLWSSNKQEHFHVTQNWFFCSGTLKWPKRSSVVKTTKHKSDLTKTLLWPPRFNNKRHSVEYLPFFVSVVVLKYAIVVRFGVFGIGCTAFSLCALSIGQICCGLRFMVAVLRVYD